MRICNKRQQATTTLPIAMNALKAITNCNGHDQRNHCEAPKCSQDEPLKRDKEGCGDQHQSRRQRMQQGHREGIVSITMTLVP
jgi:hypothetical protein